MSETAERLMDLAEAHIRHRGYGGFSFRELAAEIGNACLSWYGLLPGDVDPNRIDEKIPSTGSTTPALTAYKQATTQPLIADLYNVSVGLRDQGKGLNGNKAANAAFAQAAAGKVETDCTNAGYADPAS